MSQTITPLPVVEPQPAPPSGRPPHRPIWLRKLAVASVVLIALGFAAFYLVRGYRVLRSQTTAATVPIVQVAQGDLNLTINARGELRGQNPEVLTAPMIGGTELHITTLAKAGTPVKKGSIVVQFDTTEQEYKLKEAEADLAEAQQHILQAQAQQDAQAEEDRYALQKAHTDVTLAELDVRKDPLLAPIAVRQNELAVAGARDHLAQLEKNLANRLATDTAATAIQQAGRAKAEAQAATARQNIEAMTLRAQRDGYVSVDQNANGEFFFYGMTLPLFQTGDAVRPGMAVAEIPDLKNWEIEANIGELDRGHIAVGDTVAVEIIAVPTESFTGRVKEVGGTSGPPWNRRFTCKLALERTSSELRPGMSAQLTITTDRLRNVLWLPAQALFEENGRSFVYLRTGRTFAPKDVKLVRRNETRVVIAGLKKGETVALANPLEVSKKPAGKAGAPAGLPR